MKRPALFPIALLSLGLLVFHPGCGTDVGNAGKPIVSETSELAAVAGMQHDEVISSVSDDSDGAATALGLLGPVHEPRLMEVTTSCTPAADGSILVKTSKSLALQSEFGRPAQRKVQSDSLETALDTTYTVPAALGTLACNNDRPVISLAQLAELKLEAQFKKSRKRSVTLQADGTVISESELTLNSERSMTFAVTASLEGSKVSRTSSLRSSVALLRKNKAEVLTRQIETLENEPLVLEKTRVRGTGVTRVEIVSGAVASTHQDASKVVLRYKNLVLGLGSSCHPISGSIEGQVYGSSDATAVVSTFTMVFDSDGATLIQDDGSEEDVELESCQI